MQLPLIRFHQIALPLARVWIGFVDRNTLSIGGSRSIVALESGRLRLQDMFGALNFIGRTSRQEIRSCQCDNRRCSQRPFAVTHRSSLWSESLVAPIHN